MRKIMIVVTLCTLSWVTAPAFSGPGPGHEHSHAQGPISEETVKQKATKQVADLVKKGKIDKSWSEIKPAKAHQKTFKKDPEWVVVFANSAAPDKAKQTLYLFYTLDGHYMAANFTGK